jgi:hypothetical protein
MENVEITIKIEGNEYTFKFDCLGETKCAVDQIIYFIVGALVAYGHSYRNVINHLRETSEEFINIPD